MRRREDPAGDKNLRIVDYWPHFPEGAQITAPSSSHARRPPLEFGKAASGRSTQARLTCGRLVFLREGRPL